MGNRIGNLFPCSSGDTSRRFEDNASFVSKQHQNARRNSICYVRPVTFQLSGDEEISYMTFRSVSGATVSANSSATASTSLDDSFQHSTVLDSSASFESFGSFTSSLGPFQHQHDRGFPAAGSTERFFWAGPCDYNVIGESPIEEGSSKVRKKSVKRSLKRVLTRVFLSKLSICRMSCFKKNENANTRVSFSTGLSAEMNLHGVEGDNNYLTGDGGDVLMGCGNIHWALGKAGEDRVHIVICENDGWVFVGIYDGFNGPDATDFLLNNLFYAVNDELKEFLGGHKFESTAMGSDSFNLDENVLSSDSLNRESCLDPSETLVLDSFKLINSPKRVANGNGVVDECCSSGECKENYPTGNEEFNSEKVELSHSDVLQALSEALRKTEEAFVRTTDESHNPVLAMMGSCVLVMLMKGQDVYLMNVGDSRAIMATHAGDSLQLTMEHSTKVKEEVNRIKREHPDDPLAVTKGRVKGHLSVTRAFGAGFLKQPEKNNAVLETFRVNYIGESPYITCIPSLYHHKLTPNDNFLVLSSDGLYQYFTNEEVAAKVEAYITLHSDRDPAQLLLEEALDQAARKAGLELYELLEIPEGERRQYHDDISIVIISFEGKVWRSLV